MRSARHFSQALLLMLIAALCASHAAAAAADDDYPDEYDVTARVVRVSLLRGEVSLRRAGGKEWERAQLNFPLVEGDTLATGRDARLEIQIDARNFLRVAGDSVLRIVTLREEGIALSLSEGTATLRLARFEPEREYFEIDAPRTTLAAEKRGLYRLDVSREGNVHLAVRDGGRARIYSETSGFTLRDGRAAELSYDDTNEADWQLSKLSANDDWDEWVDQREHYLAERLRYDERERYYDREVWGAEELDAYGEWSYAGDYGWVWRPHVTVINNYYNWAPYRYGRWTWVPPYGWTWVGDEPWGWAPYHYGRWVYYNNNWCWAPRGYGYHYKRAWWRPALVAFVLLPSAHGEHVAWYPLGYGQRDPHGRHYRHTQDNRRERLSPLNSGELARLERINPAAMRAVTTLPVRSFGAGNARVQPADTEIARRAVAGEPVRGRLPIGPASAANANPTGGGAAGPITERPARSGGAARPAPLTPAAPLPERPTGAAARTPGAPLDAELRRTRLYNGREPRDRSRLDEQNINGGTGGSQDTPERSTGAVARPARPMRPSPARPDRPPVSGGDDTGRENGEPRPLEERRPMEQRRPTPPATPAPDRPTEERQEDIFRPARPARSAPVERSDEPASERPARRERPERVEQPAERPEPRHRPEPERRSEPPQPRPEPRPEPRHEEPRREQPAPSRAPEPQREQPPPRERNESRPARPSHKESPDGL